VRDYTQRQLSRPADRILAISGIATAYLQNVDESKSLQGPTYRTSLNSYVAGHWIYRLPNDLLWTVHKPQLVRSLVHQGPSWSWTSVNGPVSFGHVLWDTDILGYSASPELYESTYSTNILVEDSSEGPPRPHWSILDVAVDLVDSQAACGAVNRASLAIKGQIQSFGIISSTNCRMNSNCLDLELRFSDSVKYKNDTVLVKVSPDIANIDTNTPLSLMPLGWSYDGQHEYILRGLTLRQIPTPRSDAMPQFERCGVFQIRPNDGEDADICEAGRWRCLMPFYNSFQERTFEVI
jgi:hypothetical protein